MKKYLLCLSLLAFNHQATAQNVFERYAELSTALKQSHDARRIELQKELQQLLLQNPDFAPILTSGMVWENTDYIAISGMIDKQNQLQCKEYSRDSASRSSVLISDAVIYSKKGELTNYLSIEFTRQNADHKDLPESYLKNTLGKTIGAKLSNGQIIPLQYYDNFRTETATTSAQKDMRIEIDKTYRADFTAGEGIDIVIDLVCLK